MAASPALHERLHHHGNAGKNHERDSGCLVAQMLRGDLLEGTALAALVNIAPPRAYPAVAYLKPAAILLPQRYLSDLRSERGPPALG